MGVSFWILYKHHALNSLDLLDLGTGAAPAKITIASTTPATTIVLNAGPLGAGTSLTLSSLRWHHVAYAFSSASGTLYGFNQAVITASGAHTMPSGSSMSLGLDLRGVNLKYLHLLGSAATISDFGSYMVHGVFPYSSASTAPQLFAYIPGMSLTSTNEIAAFTLNELSPPSSYVAVKAIGLATTEATVIHPGEEGEKMATKYVVSTTEEFVTIKPSSSITGSLYTIDFWVKIVSISSGGHFKLLSSVATSYLEVTEASGFRIQFEGNSETWTATPEKWQHVAITAGSGDSLYLDGDLVASRTHLSVSITPLLICQLAIYQATVELKQLRVWGKSLTQSQVQQFSQM